jgi:NAD(P)-dependent dehydrogenase (short-subunit alcohol dehydrogenase family)
MRVENRSLNELFDLAGRAALVIGGTGYLGRALSEALAEAGACVAVGSRSQARADAAVQGLPGGYGLHLGLVCDVADEASARLAVDQAARHFGRLDILVNSTVGPRPVGIHDAEKTDFEYSLAANLIGPFIASQQAAIHMRAGGGGSIIHIGSIYGLVGGYPRTLEGLQRKMSPTYHASKGGLIQLTRYQAVWWAGDNIRVNCLSPGAFPPPSRESEFRERLAREVPLGRTGLPWELKGAVVFLASQASSYLTGHNLVVDGGWTAW